MIAGHDPRYRHLEVEVILAARGASRRRRREAAREGFDQKPSVGVEGGRLTDAVAHRRVGDRIGTATADLDLLPHPGRKLDGRLSSARRAASGSTRGQQTPPHSAALAPRLNPGRMAWSRGSPDSAALSRTLFPAVLKLLSPQGRPGSSPGSGIGSATTDEVESPPTCAQRPRLERRRRGAQGNDPRRRRGSRKGSRDPAALRGTRPSARTPENPLQKDSAAPRGTRRSQLSIRRPRVRVPSLPLLKPRWPRGVSRFGEVGGGQGCPQCVHTSPTKWGPEGVISRRRNLYLGAAS